MTRSIHTIRWAATASACLVVVLTLVVPAAGAADRTALLPATAGDLVATRIATAEPVIPTADLSRDPVTFAWPIEAGTEVADRVDPQPVSSREYWLHVSGRELAGGVPVATTAPGAVVRLNPLASRTKAAAAALDPAELVITDPDGTAHPDGAAFDRLVDARRLKASGAPFAEGTSAFRIRPALGAGTFKLSAPAVAAQDRRTWVLHVFEPGSAVVSTAVSSALSYHRDQPAVVTIALDGADRLEVSSFHAELISPDGRRTPVPAEWRGDRSSSIELALDETRAADGLWEVEARLVGTADGLEVRRDVRTAFAIATPTARFTGPVEVARGQGELHLRFAVETAAAGRFEVRGVLWATTEDGLQPTVVAHSARWIGAGTGDLTIEIPAALAEDIQAPFELRDLQLIDQGRMAVLHRQARALAVR